MKRLLASLLLITCAHAPAPTDACVTACGLRGPSNCAELAAVTREAAHAIAQADGLRESSVCDALRGWSIRMMPHADDDPCLAPGWIRKDASTPGHPFCVLGYTEIEEKVIELPTDDWRRNSLMHEMIHAIEWSTFARVGHCGWKERGLKDALRDVTGHFDETKPESTCPELPGFWRDSR